MMKLKDANSFIQVLHEDVNHCVIKLNENDDFEFWGRAYIRAYSSLVEGIVFIYQDLVTSLWHQKVLDLSTEQQLFFNRVEWKPTTAGDIKITEAKTPSIKAVKCLFRQLGILLSNYNPDFQSNGWRQLKEFYPIRNKLTHPKEMTSLIITHEILTNIEESREWLNSQLKEVNNEVLSLLKPDG